MKRLAIVLCALMCTSTLLHAQTRVPIGTKSTPESSEVSLTLTNRIQHYNRTPKDSKDKFDTAINSPKSVNILFEKSKYYVNSLEGFETVVYDLNTHEQLKVIKHTFNSSNQHLFSETNFFDYTFRTTKGNPNVFRGKPVEGCFSHNGRYFWVTYYRRSFDRNAIDPSALCIIDTETDEIVRVMPTGPLPKMISSSPDNQRVAVTHWGDNTVALIDVSSPNVKDFRYLENISIGNRMRLNFAQDSTVNRDQNCGLCLRGTIFSPDSKYLLVGQMGGASVSIIDVKTQKHIGSVSGAMPNIRHLVIHNGYLYLSINRDGYVQKANFTDILNNIANKNFVYRGWENARVGTGARTISIHPSGKYIFAAVNNDSKISIIRTSDMKVIGSCEVDSFPVGMDICDKGETLITTSQGRSSQGGGNSVSIYRINIK